MSGRSWTVSLMRKTKSFRGKSRELILTNREKDNIIGELRCKYSVLEKIC
ncbi:hypothetical protein LINPERPRIM_LOCUS22630, partial [Linum perenne]